jgi:hypothetical protein
MLANPEGRTKFVSLSDSRIKLQGFSSRDKMKLRGTRIGALALFFFFSFVRAAQPQIMPSAAPLQGPFRYDLSQEITLNGTVAGVLPRRTPEKVAGAHLILTTLSGPVDVSLGTFALQGQDPLSVAPGQQIEVTGIPKTLKGKPFFLARLIKVGDRVYEIRNEHGIPISPLARERARQKSAQQGSIQQGSTQTGEAR